MSARFRGGLMRMVVQVQRRRSGARMMTSSAPRIVVEKDELTALATLRLSHGPVNSLGRPFVEELTKTLKELENDPQVNGLVLTSSCKNVFSAGLDLQEIIKPEPAKVRQFWHAMQELWLTLYATPLATVAAINGAAPAAGCLLAMSCDYRVMAPDYKIGLNETRFGLVAPTWFVDLTVNTVGVRQAEKLLFPGALITAQEALHVGLIDEMVPPDTVQDIAKQRLSSMIKGVDRAARHETKLSVRGKAIERLRANREADLDWFVAFALRSSTQEHLAKYMAGLKAKTNK